jgi:hypothetical protein
MEADLRAVGYGQGGETGPGARVARSETSSETATRVLPGAADHARPK